VSTSRTHRFPARSATSSSRSNTPADGPRRGAPLAHVALGGNLGDPLAALIAAATALGRLGELVAVSAAWLTEPVGGPAGQPTYRNAVALWRPAAPWRSPSAALAAMLAIERALGRERRERWGPRRIDLDLLAYDAAEDHGRPARPEPSGRRSRPELPHPRALERAFVLLPWAQVAPDWVHPVPGRPLADLAEAIDRSGARALGGAVGLDQDEARRWAAAFGTLTGPW
jgi:2-amino-4-hydroxy-6-hydroxymethyldihydropteridine diphosphokinase